MCSRLNWLIEGLSRAISNLLSLALVVLIPLVLYGAVLDRTLLDPGFYKSSLVQHDAYERIAPELVDEVVRRTLLQTGTSRVRSLFSKLTEDDWRPIIGSLAPPDWLRSVMEGEIDALFAWLHSSDPYPTLLIPVGDIRDRLRTGAGGQQLAEAMLNGQPLCTPQQLQAVASGSGLPACAPPPELVGQATALLLPQLDAFFGQAVRITDPGADPAEGQVDLTAAIRVREGGEALFQQLRMWRSSANSVRSLTLLGLATILLFLGLIHLLAVRSWQGWSQWLGLVLFVAGGLALGPVLLVPAWLHQSLAALADKPMTERPLLAIIHLGQWLAEDFSAEMTRIAGLAGGAMILLGLLLLIISIFLPAGQPEAIGEGEEG